MHFIRMITYVIFASLLIACTTQPSHLIVSPELMNVAPVNYHEKSATLTVNDLRVGNQIIQIQQNDDEVLTLISASERLENTVSKTLTTHWQKQGLALTDLATNKITITIKKALIEVKQQLLKHSAKNSFVIQIEVNNGEKTLTTEYKSTNIEESPLRADVAALTLDFNQRLSSALTWILNNKEIQQFIK